MRVLRWGAERFRNLEPFDQPVGAQFVVLHGPNAQGKTNAIEVLHVLSTLKPLRGRRLREAVRFDEPGAAVAATVDHQGVQRQLRVEVNEAQRKVLLDGKPCSDLNEYFAAIRAIAFAPSDAAIVTADPSFRRNWVDRAAFTQSPTHLDRVRTVRRVLDQKAAALKSHGPDGTLLDALDHQLAVAGADLVEQRSRLLEALTPHVARLHDTIAGGNGRLAIELVTKAAGADRASRAESLGRALAHARPRELARRTTLVGPQHDDLQFSIDGHAVREFASRGQVRSVVLALKLAEMVVSRERGLVPLFLIDDVSSELDAQRTARVVGLLSELGAQVFATTTDPAPLLAVLPREDTLSIGVSSGVLAAP